MTDLPVWLQEIRDRANKATKGPWYVMEDDDDLCMCMVGVAKDPMNSYGNYGNTIAITLLQAPRVADVDDARWDENADFIAHSRTDVPRLIELVGEMAGALEAASEHLGLGQYVQSPGKCRVCGGYVHTKCLTICEQCAARMVREALDKYRGEVEP